MNVRKITFFVLTALLLIGCGNGVKMEMSDNAISIPLAGNTYVTSGKGDAFVSTDGIVSWTGEEAVLSTWFKVSQIGDLKLFVKVKAASGSSAIKLTYDGNGYSINVKDEEEDKIIPVGYLHVKNSGYQRIDMQGVKREGGQFPIITELIIDGEVAEGAINYVHDFEPYWGLRGPSVHMKYALPETNVEYFYNEITVPEGEDKLGSYFMANGFGEGYCGIQVNSETERRILFSVWSPFETNNPDSIPQDQRIQLLGKGEKVFTGEFGNEGSGGQSYLIYPWKAGITYKFLTRVCPDTKGNTQYYAWFFEPEEEQWKLIAGFLRPKTNTWYTNAHSFLENFMPEQGYLERSVRFGNQWARTDKGEWYELIEGVFSYDATARAQVRLDYAGGVDGDFFFLKNGGFFNDNTELGSIFTRPLKNNQPKIEIDKLPLNEEITED